MKASFDRNIQNNYGNTALHHLVLHSDSLEIFDAFIESGFDPLQKNGSRQTLFHLASMRPLVGRYFSKIPKSVQESRLFRPSLYNRIKICNRLLELGIDVNSLDDYGFTALYYVVCFKRLDLLERLLEEENIDIHRTKSSDSFTPLFKAISTDWLDGVQLLLSHGADKNAPLIEMASP